MTDSVIYMDYMATTPVDSFVIDKMVDCLGIDGTFGNPASSTHAYGQAAARAVMQARREVAELIGAEPIEIIFTSGATESDNLAILGAARFYQRKGRHIITMQTEHKAVLDSFHALEREGFSATYLQPKANGLLDLDDLLSALREDTILVSIMHVNNEIGVIQDIDAIGALLHGKGIIFHVDAAQSAGKIPIDLKKTPVDLMSFSAHKNYGPKGVGALFVRQFPKIHLQPQSFGGSHERGLRSGTLATHQIVGMGAAFALSGTHLIDEQAKILTLRNKLWDGIKDLPGIQLNGDFKQRLAGNLNVSFNGIDANMLMQVLSGLAFSTASACSSESSSPSYVLHALGISDRLARSTLRLSIGRFTTEQEIDKAVRCIVNGLTKLGAIDIYRQT